MKTLLLMAFVCLFYSAGATDYYFSSSSGDDARSASQATSSSTPWKSINKLNAIFTTLKPGDKVLFKRGDTFYGSINVTASGSSTAPITLSAYGSGNKPVITGFTTLTNWVSLGNGRYESYNTSLGSKVNMVSFNGSAQAMGRYPNSNTANGGFLSFESHGTSSITDNQLPSSPNWTGAELVVRTNRWSLDRSKITSHSGTQLSYSSALSYTPVDGFGYFIQNDIKTLDQLGEWYYNPSTKKMTVFFGTNTPSSYIIKASTLNLLVNVYNQDNVVLDNLSFTGANEQAINSYSADNFLLKNSEITLSGIDGAFMSNGRNVQVQNSNISGTNNTAITLSNCTYSLIKNNTIASTSLLPGMGENGGNKSIGIRETGNNNLIEGNSVQNTGYVGIMFKGDYTVIKNNFINNFNLIKDDGGGIYTGNSSATDDQYGQKIIGNIVVNGIGAPNGTKSSVAGSTTGIYMDDHASNVEILNNTVSNCNKTGIYIHNANHITLRNNTLYDNKTQLTMVHDGISADDPIRGMVIKNNTFFSKHSYQSVLTIGTILNDIGSMGVMDSNYYCRPLDDDYIIKANYVNAAGAKVSQEFDLEGWKTVFKKDLASKITAKQIKPHTLNTLIGSNRFSNGDFNSNISGLNVPSSASWHSSKINGGTLQGAISSNPSFYVVSVPIGTISAGKKYIVKFSAQGTKKAAINVYVRTPGAPYAVLSNDGVKSAVKAETVRKDYEYAFTPLMSESNAVLFLEVCESDHTVWMDNVKIHEADITMTNPEDSIRYVYNASMANTTVGLNGTYIDARNKAYSNSITLAPYTSAVLIKTSTTTTTTTTSTAPVVAVTSPTANANFAAPASVTITAAATDADGTISKVEFYRGTTLIKTESSAPYTWTWSSLAAGTYSITAKAYDNSGKTTTSAPVTFTVGSSTSSTTTTTAPVVKITSPLVDANYGAPASVTVTATASDADGTISKVLFYNGTTLIKTESTAPYTWIWSSVAAGTYNLTAKAYDNSGKVTTSSAVKFTVGNLATSTTSGSTAPSVKITSPTLNANYGAPASVTLTASATDGDGTISKVEFYNGSSLIVTEKLAPYSWTWSNVAAGTYKLTAKAYDNSGKVSTSSIVTFTVGSTSPVVAITSPKLNASYGAPASVTVTATATDGDGTISKVLFYNGTTLLKTESTAPYTWTWSNVAAGTYKLTAKAYDNSGKSTTSSIVTFTVGSSLSAAETENINDGLALRQPTTGTTELIDFRLFPNPAVNKIQVEFNAYQNSNKANLVIQNAAGSTMKNIPVVLAGNVIEVDISSLSTGMYVLSISTEKGIISKKFLKGN